MDSHCWVPTPKGDVIYSMSYLDLKETGPLVVAAPPNVIGMFTDLNDNLSLLEKKYELDHSGYSIH
jgi:hypothetical protein